MICIGKTGTSFLIEGEKEYQKRLGHYCQFEKIEIPDLKNAKKISEDLIKKKEGELLLSKTTNSDYVVLLDENGKQYTSLAFADYLQKKFNQGGKCITFIIGGAYGFSDEVYNRSNDTLSLSKMTFSHQMIRVIFVEQLYRGFTILKGEPYHHQ